MKTLNKHNQHELNINIDSLPEWANYIAMDRNGEWFAYEKKPVLRRHLNDWWNPERGKVRLIKVSYKYEDWEESLLKIDKNSKKHKWYNEIIAFSEGKEIEVRCNHEGAPWFLPATTPQFCNPKYEFRVKTKPKYKRDHFRSRITFNEAF